MPYDEGEVRALTPGIQRMMAQLVLAGWRFDKWMSGGVVVYSIDKDTTLVEETDLSMAIMEAHLKRVLGPASPSA